MLNGLQSSIRTKIIFPYFILTMAVALVGAYVVTQLVSASLEERLKNRLIDSGRAVSDAVVDQEIKRLEIERLIAFTEGLPEAVAAGDYPRLLALVSPIAANHQTVDSVIIVDASAREALRLTRADLGAGDTFDEKPGSLASFQDWPVVTRVLQGSVDEQGDKFTQLAQPDDSDQIILYTIGPLRQDERVVGAVLVGTYLTNLLRDLKQVSQADVTLYDRSGLVLDTTFGGGQEGVKEILRVTPDFYRDVLAGGEIATYTGSKTIFGRSYRLAYSPFVLRGEFVGIFSVGWPEAFLVEKGTTSRNLFTGIFFVAMVAVISIGLLVARTILRPISRLVTTSQQIRRGDLSQRTGISSPDEIGRLALTFDEMTQNLELRTQQLEHLLKVQEEEARRTQAILSSIADGVIVQNKNGEIITMNPAARRLLDRLAEEVDRDPLEFLPFSPAEIMAGTEAGEARRFEVSNFAFSAVAGPVVSADGDVMGVVVVLRDITREVESEQLKNEFLKSISHELLSPLVPIKGSTDLLLMTGADKLDERHIKLVRRIEEYVEELQELITTLVDVTYVEGDSLGLERRELHLDEIIATVHQSWLPTAAKRNQRLVLNLPPERPLRVEADKARILRVLNSLLDNACKYTPDGGQIELRVTVREDEVQVDVADNGVGIAQAAQRFIFKRFFRALNEEVYEVRGAGLGLYLSQAIIKAHNGRIWFESEEHKGSTFSFTLPLEQTSPVEDADEVLAKER